MQHILLYFVTCSCLHCVTHFNRSNGPPSQLPWQQTSGTSQLPCQQTSKARTISEIQYYTIFILTYIGILLNCNSFRPSGFQSQENFPFVWIKLQMKVTPLTSLALSSLLLHCMWTGIAQLEAVRVGDVPCFQLYKYMYILFIFCMLFLF